MAFKFPDDFPSVAAVSKTKASDKAVTFNGQRYYFVAILDNGEDVIQLPNKYIDEFVLNDALLGFEQSGFISYRDPYLSVRQLFSFAEGIVGEDCLDVEDSKTYSNFSFSGGGKERLHIKMVPIPNEELNSESEKPINETPASGDWYLMQTFVITSIDDTPDRIASKRFTLNFIGIESYVVDNLTPDPMTLGEFKAQSSNNTLEENKTGELMYMYISNALGAYSRQHNFETLNYLPVINYGTQGPNMELIESETKGKRNTWRKVKGEYKKLTSDLNEYDVWDFGDDKSFHPNVLGQKETARTIINKCLDIHCSSHKETSSSGINLNLDPCILKLKRAKNENETPKITLRPLVSFFENFGNLTDKEFGDEYMDTFYIEEPESLSERLTGVIKGIFRAVNPCDDDEGKLKITSQPVTRFELGPTQPSDAEKFFRSHFSRFMGPIKGKGENIKDGLFKNVVSYIGEKYIKFFRKTKEDPVKLVNVRESENDQNLWFETSIPSSNALVALGRNKLIQTIIYLNDHITFRIQGSTHRQSGQFFSVDLPSGSDPDSDTLNKVLGVYWATDITHELDFSDNTYTNEVTGTKFYRHNSFQYIDPNNIPEEEAPTIVPIQVPTPSNPTTPTTNPLG